MANGHGGRRPGAGRPRKDAALRLLDGNAGHRKVVAHPSVPPAAGAEPALTLPTKPAIVIDEEHAPDDLSVDERNVWLKLGPLAVEAGTLTKAEMFAFCLLCRNVVLERRYAASVTEAGGAGHRGLIQILDRELGRFGLAPCGKTTASESIPKPAVDPIKDKYFGHRGA